MGIKLKKDLEQSISVLLEMPLSEALDTLPLTYEAMYNACFAVVRIYEGGDALYDALKILLEKFVSRLKGEILMPVPEPLKAIVDAFEWFEKRVVRCSCPHNGNVLK